MLCITSLGLNYFITRSTYLLTPVTQFFHPPPPSSDNHQSVLCICELGYLLLLFIDSPRKRVFPCGSAGKESVCSVRDLGLIPGLGRSPGEGKGFSSTLAWRILKELDTTEQLSLSRKKDHTFLCLSLSDLFNLTYALKDHLCFCKWQFFFF